MRARWWLCGLLALATLQGAAAQTGTDVPEIRRVDAEAWERAVEGLDYTEASPPPPEPVETRTWSEPVWTSIVAYAVLGVLIVGLLYLALRYWVPRADPAQPPAPPEDPDRVEDLRALDPDALAGEARARGDWSAALRWSFLALLRDLDRGGWIAWAREKTNRAYARELRGRAEVHAAFRRLANAFERSRYGGAEPDRAAFEALAPGLEALRRQIPQRPA